MRVLRRALVAVLFLAVPLAGCVTPPAAEVDPAALPVLPEGLDELGLAPRVFEKLTFVTFQTTSATGRIVHAEAWVPDVSSYTGEGEAPTAFPTILIASPYWGGGTGGTPPSYPAYGYWVNEGVLRGYAVVFGDNAGNGGSGGCWDFMGPEEQAASVALVEGIAAQPWSDGKVGMIGISYDGMTQIMASSRAAEHLVTVVPVAPLTHAYAGLYQNGVHYGGGWMRTTASYTQSSVLPPAGMSPLSERLPGYVERMAQTPACAPDNIVTANDPSGEYSAYYAARDFRPLAKAVKASVFFIQGFLDANVKADNAFPWANDVPTPRKMWLGQWFHQFPQAAASGREDMFVTIHRWFDHELKGIENGILDEPMIDVQDSQGRWRHEASWPPVDAVDASLYLAPDALAMEPPAESTVALGGTRAGAEALAAQAYATAVPIRPANLPVATSVVRFTGEELAEPLHVAGIPTFSASVASSQEGGQLVVRVYDSDGQTMRRITQGAMNLRLHAGLDQPRDLAPGEYVTVSFPLYPTDYVVPAGHQVIVEIAASTTDTWYLADPYAAELTMKLGGDDGARLGLPSIVRADDSVFLVACGMPLSSVVEGCYDEDRKDKGVAN